MKTLNNTKNNFDNLLNKLLLQRKKKIQSSFISVTSIVKDVKKNGDKALLKYEKRFNKNKTIVPSSKQINNSIKSLNQKVKSKNIDQKNHELVLELIGIDYLKNKEDYEINLIFNNNAYIALTTETIEVRLEDQNEIKD